MRITAMLGWFWAVAAGANAAGVAASAADQEIVLKQIDPARVVYLEHTGPYWTIGPLVKQVSEAMVAHDELGPMFARYLADPAAVPADSLRTEVGFVAKGEWLPTPPFKTAQREGEQVVSIVVEGSYGTTTRYYPKMRNWLSTQGFEAVGPVIELFPAVPRGAPVSAHRTEIQIPVRRASSVGNAPSKSRVAVVPPRKLDAAVVVPVEEDSGASTLKEPLSSIKDLLESSRFDRIAEQLVPTDRSMPAAMQVWLGQVVFRVSAVAKGLEQTYPGGSPDATALAEAFIRRYRLVSASSKVDPLEQAVVRVDIRSDPQSASKRLIVRDLDNLLGRVALKTVDANSALDRLSDILQRVQDLTNSPTVGQ